VLGVGRFSVRIFSSLLCRFAREVFGALLSVQIVGRRPNEEYLGATRARENAEICQEDSQLLWNVASIPNWDHKQT
jgi:hypothetical protein